ncbi:MAG: putative DNA modification/repair radical SAM protein, partial [Synergistaceae bacterium]|nr:putative DNA modification/repair radical SAM protein [Synergistaceae bacterium]
SWTDDGRCVSLLKILLSNDCAYDCAYCVNRRSNDRPRATFSPDEAADLTINFYRRNYIEGLFLSSGVLRSPDDTMVNLIRAVTILRKKYRFNGYIHVKAIPGASAFLVERLGLLADRMSVNIELPTERSLRALAPQKTKNAIFTPMRFISGRINEAKETKPQRRLSLSAPRFVPAGQTTQLIIGATPETDLNILRLSEGLYGKIGLKRVYYSAYMAVNEERNLPALVTAPPLLREHRLYQADWLLRYYGFTALEIVDERSPALDETMDPKAAWAMRNLHIFPMDVNKADYEQILRIPGIGVTSAKRIVVARRARRLRHDDLKKLGVVMKRATHFLTCDGRVENMITSSERLRFFMSDKPARQQLTLPFEPILP